MGLCLGVGIYGFYSAQTRSPGAFEILAESTALGTFDDFEWEILYYQVRGFNVIPYLTNEEFLYMFKDYESPSKTATFIEVTKEELRDITLKSFSSEGSGTLIYAVFDIQKIYVFNYDDSTLTEKRYYCWSPP